MGAAHTCTMYYSALDLFLVQNSNWKWVKVCGCFWWRQFGSEFSWSVSHTVYGLEPRLSVLDFVSNKNPQSCETKSGTESLGLRLMVPAIILHICQMNCLQHFVDAVTTVFWRVYSFCLLVLSHSYPTSALYQGTQTKYIIIVEYKSAWWLLLW